MPDSRIAIKICGICGEEAISALNYLKVEYAGFVHYPASPRHVSTQKAAALKSSLSKKIQTISVLVDPHDALIAELITTLKPDFFQLHGKETNMRIQEIRSIAPQTKIIKSISVRTSDDIASAMQFADVADMFLFDAKPPENFLPGGNGLSFDWNLLAGREFPKPWMLSGGLNAENVARAIAASGAQMVDVSSSVESAPGVKDPALIEAFVKAARNEI